jgi:5-methyltetrahydrofolate--homocysteine methyltransferase
MQLPATTILNEGLMPGMSVIGRQFRDNDVYVPEVIMAAQALAAGVKILKPSLVDHCARNRGKVMLATVPDDIHDLGKNILGIMLEGAGFSVVDLGVDVPVSKIVKSLDAERPDILGLSCTLTITLSYIKEIIKVVREAPAGKQVKILIGGLSVTPGFAKSVGADAYGIDASIAVQKALAMMSGASRNAAHNQQVNR